MSIIDDIETEISRVQTNISNAFDVLEDKGVTILADKSSNNLVVSVEGALPRIPTNCNGLVFWLDGDCNTRAGLDRSKKYFENLVWNKPISSVETNQEIFQTNNTNSWNENRLVVNSWALYPRYYMGNTGSITIEWVMKKTTADYRLSGFHMASQGGYALFSSNSASVNFYFNNDGTYVSNPANIQLNTIYYICARYDYTTKEGHLIIPALSIDSVKTNLVLHSPTSKIVAGFGVGASLIPSEGGSGTPEGTDYTKGGEIGMVRVWSRALSNNEISANYADAKTRFNCV